MDKNNIINSGQLEAYCLGQLSIEDAQIISDLAEHDSDIKNELDQIMNTLESYPNKLTPNPQLKTKVLDSRSTFTSRRN
jgi:anti-sigma-K factor RskA